VADAPLSTADAEVADLGPEHRILRGLDPHPFVAGFGPGLDFIGQIVGHRVVVAVAGTRRELAMHVDNRCNVRVGPDL
jgi:hypothetical protein